MIRIVFAISSLIVFFSFSIDMIEKKDGLEFVRQEDNIDKGERLARLYCGMCHLFPEPALLDRKTWLENVLPNMGLRLGIRNGKDPYEDLLPEERSTIQLLNIYPKKALLTNAEWKKIVDYYERTSPTYLEQSKNDFIVSGNQFQAEVVFIGEQHYPQTSLLKFDSVSRNLYVGDLQNMLYVLNDNFVFRSAWFTESPPVDIDFPANQPLRLLTIGTFKPSDQKKGRLLSLDTTGNFSSDQLVNIDSLLRPVQFASGDLNMDGREDVVICNFGNNRGELVWYEEFNPQKKHVLKTLPGARMVEIRDMNNDGKPDIIALMAQAWEEVVIFYNLGNGAFKEVKILQFSPLFGVSSFELVDFNKDGHLDILLTNGDNWDYSPIEKSFHGVRIFMNNGKNKFSEKYFFPLSGASKALAVDFDNDGDLDIAVISMYSKKQLPEHNFIYLENIDNNRYQPYCFPEAAFGKWLTMEVADFNSDGYQDIVLGSYIHTVLEATELMSNGITNLPQLLILHNRIK